MTPSEQKTAELFYKAILSLENVSECADFFKDVCTKKELLSIAQRYMVAKMLKERWNNMIITRDRLLLAQYNVQFN
mgnify:CR=1 FL=1